MKNENRTIFRTFNPIHVGHLIIANHMAENSDLDQVWLVVTPHNPFKKKSTLLDDYHRLQMAHLATEDFPKLKPSDIEFKLSQPNYTVNTLVHLEEKYPNHEFSLIMGKDNLTSLSKWKILKLFCKIMRSMSIHASKPRSNSRSTFIRVGKLRFKKSPKSTFN
jgi:nicotinate-nucleotide adenylyltransferase